MIVKKVFFGFFILLVFLLSVAIASSIPTARIPSSVSAMSKAKLVEIKPNTILSVQMNKPNGSVYRSGETIFFTVKNNLEGYLYILDITPSGTVTQLFPNYYQRNNFIKAGIHRIPSIRSYKFTVSGKTSGLEFIEYILSSRPVDFLQKFSVTKANPFPIVGNGTKKEFTKFKVSLMKSLVGVSKRWTAWTYFYLNSGKIETKLEVNSTPNGAKVILDGKAIGFAPVTLAIDPGYHSITLSLDGYKEWKGIVYVEFGKEKILNVNLLPLNQSVYGKLQIKVNPDDATVYVDGNEVGSGKQVLKLLIGYHSVEVKRNGYQTYYNGAVEIKANETTILNVKLTPLTANLYIHSQPYVNVYIDGVFAGGTGYDGILYLQGVRVGYHKIKFSKEWYVNQTVGYNVLPGDNYISMMLTAAGMLRVNSNVYPISVEVDNDSFGEITNPNYGIYVPVGTHTITFSNPEYLAKRENLTFEFQKTTLLALNLKLKPLSVSINVSPNPFSPNGDWYEDTTTFHVNLSRKGLVKIQIYSNDKLIWYREINATYGDNEISWNGNSIDGVAMPNGIYKVVFTVKSYGQTMTKSATVVINKNNYTYLKEILIIGGIALVLGVLYLLFK